MDPRIAQRRARVAEGRVRRGLIRLLVVLAVVALGAVTVWVLRSPAFQVDEIVIRGALRTPAEALLGGAGVVEGVPLITVDAEQAEAALEQDPWVADATVSRRWPRQVVVTVDERVPAAWVLTRDGWVEAAIDGTALSEAEAPPSAAALIRLPELDPATLDDADDALGALAFADTLDPAVASSTEIARDGEELIASVGGYTVRLGRPQHMREKALALEAVLESDPAPGSVITLISPTRPAVLPPGAEESLEDDEEGTEEPTDTQTETP